MYKKYLLLLGLVVFETFPAQLTCPRVSVRRLSAVSTSRNYSDDKPITREELVKRCMAIVDSKDFYHETKKIHAEEPNLYGQIAIKNPNFTEVEIELQVRKKVDEAIREIYMGKYQRRHQKDWRTHEKQMHQSSHVARNLIEQKYANDQCCTIL